MNEAVDRSELPALRLRDPDLPSLLPAARRHEPPLRRLHPAWANIASQVEVRSVAVGPEGDVWLATPGGVLQWHADLERYTRYGSEHGLPGNAVRAVAVGGDGVAWAISDSGRLAELTDDGWIAARDDARLSCLAVDGSGRVWVAGEDGVGPAGGPRSAGFGADFLPGAPRALAVAADDDMWAAGPAGLYQFDGSGWRRRLPRPAIAALVHAGTALWVGAADGLERIELPGGARRRPAGAPGLPVTALAADGDGVWAAASWQVGRATAEAWSRLPGKLPAVTAVAARGSEVVIGTRAGPMRARPETRPLPHLTGASPDVLGQSEPGGYSPGLSNHVQALAVEDGPTVWIGTPAGLFRYDPTGERWRRVGEQRMGDVRALARTEDGMLVAGWRDGLRSLAGGTLGAAAADVNGPLTALADGGGWAGGYGGLYRRDGAGWVAAAAPWSLPAGAWVTAIAAAADVWVGTPDGLFRLQGSELDAPVGELRDAAVRALLASGDELLCGTADGLYAVADGRASAVDGFAGTDVLALAGAGEGCAWVGTAAGLYRAERGAGGWAARRRATTADSGLGAERVCALAPDPGAARLWIGTVSGLSRWDFKE